MTDDLMTRQLILQQAEDLVTGQRSRSYGSFRDQMVAIADMFNALHGDIPEAPQLDPRHVSLIMMLLKLRRRITAGDLDSSVDLCGYAALDAEFFTPEPMDKEE